MPTSLSSTVYETLSIPGTFSGIRLVVVRPVEGVTQPELGEERRSRRSR
jgi:hypothetical protein